MKRAYLFIILTAAGVACFDAIDIVYFRTLGYSLAFIGLMTSAFNIAVSVAELPAAILFDRRSNKMVLQLGNLIRMASFGLFFSNRNPATLVTAQVMAGVGVAATSGTSNALVVNAIRETRSPDSLARTFGRISYLVAAANLVGGGVGIVLFMIHPQLIWLGAIAFFIVAAVVIMTFRDVRPEIKSVPWRKYFGGVARAVRSRSALILIVTNASAIAPYFLYQLKFASFSLTYVFVGFILMNVATALGPFLMTWLKITVRHLWIIALANLVTVILFAFTTDITFASITFVLHVMLQVVQVAMASGYYHSGVEDSSRAASASAISMLDSIIVAILAPIIGVLAQVYGIAWGIALSCVLYAVVAALSITRGTNRTASGTAQEAFVE